MGRKKKPEEHENLERWLVSYADFITLLFAFFTTMYAISTVDAQKMGRMVLSMQAAFDPTGFSSNMSTRVNPTKEKGDTKDGNSVFFKSIVAARATPHFVSHKKATVRKRQTAAAMAKIKEELSELIVTETLRDKLRIIIQAKGVVISLAEAGFFKSGAHAVQEESWQVLDKISRYLLHLQNRIRVEGHTDNIAIKTPCFASNWDLSTARATFIISYMIKKHGFDPRRLSAAGYAEYHPIASNDTAEGRLRNRRVDIIVLMASSEVDEIDPY